MQFQCKMDSSFYFFHLFQDYALFKIPHLNVPSFHEPRLTENMEGILGPSGGGCLLLPTNNLAARVTSLRPFVPAIWRKNKKYNVRNLDAKINYNVNNIVKKRKRTKEKATADHSVHPQGSPGVL